MAEHLEYMWIVGRWLVYFAGAGLAVGLYGLFKVYWRLR